jgi:tRNA modification GTPase
MLENANDPIIAIATAAGRGAVGIVRISGTRLAPLVEALCGQTPQPREAAYLAFRDGDGSPIDHGLAIYFPAPRSFTGEDVLELQMHGGPVVLQLVLQRCLQVASQLSTRPASAHCSKLRLAQPGEFSRRAFLNDKIDLTQAEAIADLIDASTEAAARSASRSLAGDFSREVSTLLQALIQLRMLVEATLDFPEEEIDFLQQADAAGQLARLQGRVLEVLARTRQGSLLREGLRVVIAGQPNAGKSSLLNALAGAELAIVTPIAGTTRDVVQQAIQIAGVPIHIVDTAGLRDQSNVDAVERIGIDRAWAQMERADALLFLHDLTRCETAPYQQADQDIAAKLALRVPPSVAVIHVWNKADASPHDPQTERRVGVQVSAKTGQGLEVLRQTLLDVAGWQSHNEGLYMARERHVQALRAVQAHLHSAQAWLDPHSQNLDLLAEELRQAQQALGEITGQFSADDLLGVIFSSFCIGK